MRLPPIIHQNQPPGGNFGHQPKIARRSENEDDTDIERTKTPKSRRETTTTHPFTSFTLRHSGTSRNKSIRSNTPSKNSKKRSIKRIPHYQLLITKEKIESLFFFLLKIPPCVFTSEDFRSSSPPPLLLSRKEIYSWTVARFGGNE